MCLSSTGLRGEESLLPGCWSLNVASSDLPALRSPQPCAPTRFMSLPLPLPRELLLTLSESRLPPGKWGRGLARAPSSLPGHVDPTQPHLCPSN